MLRVLAQNAASPWTPQTLKSELRPPNCDFQPLTHPEILASASSLICSLAPTLIRNVNVNSLTMILKCEFYYCKVCLLECVYLRRYGVDELLLGERPKELKEPVPLQVFLSALYLNLSLILMVLN